jgi:fatty-acyl-CoA synthase
VAGFIPAQDEQGWFSTGDLGYLTEHGHVVICGRAKDVIIMAGRNIYPTDIERAAAEAQDVRAGNTVAVRLSAGEGRHRESFLVAVESRKAGDADAEQLIRKDVTSRVVSAVGVRPAEVVVLAPGSLPKTPSGKLRRAATGELLAGRA